MRKEREFEKYEGSERKLGNEKIIGKHIEKFVKERKW